MFRCASFSPFASALLAPGLFLRGRPYAPLIRWCPYPANPHFHGPATCLTPPTMWCRMAQTHPPCCRTVVTGRRWVSRAILGHSGDQNQTILGSWDHLGIVLASFRPFWCRFDPVLGSLWALLGYFCPPHFFSALVRPFLGHFWDIFTVILRFFVDVLGSQLQH